MSREANQADRHQGMSHPSPSHTGERFWGQWGHHQGHTSAGRQTCGWAHTYSRSPTRMTNIWRCSRRRGGFGKAESPTSAEKAKVRRSKLAKRLLSGCSGFIDRPRPLPIMPETRRHSWD